MSYPYSLPFGFKCSLYSVVCNNWFIRSTSNLKSLVIKRNFNYGTIQDFKLWWASHSCCVKWKRNIRYKRIQANTYIHQAHTNDISPYGTSDLKSAQTRKPPSRNNKSSWILHSPLHHLFRFQNHIFYRFVVLIFTALCLSSHHNIVMICTEWTFLS